MADSEKVQDQQQPQQPLKQKHSAQNHADSLNGNESSTESIEKPKQIIGTYYKCELASLCIFELFPFNWWEIHQLNQRF